MCYEIVQINFDVEAIPDDKLVDPENKPVADYGTRGLYPFSFPAEFLAEAALEQMFADYERVLSGDTGELDQEGIATIKKVFEYPVGLVEIHTGEVILYRDAPRPDLSAFETSDVSKLAYGLADLRMADPSTSNGVVTAKDRLEACFGYSLLGVPAQTIVDASTEYIEAALDSEGDPDGSKLDAVTRGIAEKLVAAMPANLKGAVKAVDIATGQEVELGHEPENPFGGLKLRG